MTPSDMCWVRLTRRKIIIHQALQLRSLRLTAFNHTVFRAWMNHEYGVFGVVPVLDEEFDLLLRLVAGEDL